MIWSIRDLRGYRGMIMDRLVRGKVIYLTATPTPRSPTNSPTLPTLSVHSVSLLASASSWARSSTRGWTQVMVAVCAIESSEPRISLRLWDEVKAEGGASG